MSEEHARSTVLQDAPAAQEGTKLAESLQFTLTSMAERLIIQSNAKVVVVKGREGAYIVEFAMHEADTEQARRHRLLDKDVITLDLSVRTSSILQNANIRYIGQLVQLTEREFLTRKNAGRKPLVELRRVLNPLGLDFGMSVEGWAPPSQRE
ncbi:hypothetical protein EDM68_00870 [Candidatus Uhrbacteria bacterium]|nr:MAG: hypothetical protein EDM68_00870 [Candidatus Uhrbacteria bacterium]